MAALGAPLASKAAHRTWSTVKPRLRLKSVARLVASTSTGLGCEEQSYRSDLPVSTIFSRASKPASTSPRRSFSSPSLRWGIAGPWVPNAVDVIPFLLARGKCLLTAWYHDVGALILEGEDKYWLPRSQLEEELQDWELERLKQLEESGEFRIPMWLFESKTVAKDRGKWSEERRRLVLPPSQGHA